MSEPVVDDVGSAEQPIGTNRGPLSDEVRASIAAVRAAQETARARARRATVRTRTWFGGIAGVVGLAVIVFGPRLGRHASMPSTVVAAPAHGPGAPSTAPANIPAPTPSTAPAESPPSAQAAPADPVAVPALPTGPAAPAVAETGPALAEPSPTPTESATALATQDTGGCNIIAGQPRWRVDADACAKLFESHPNDAALALTIAHAHHAKGHIAQSGEWARRAIALDSHAAEAYVILARAEGRAGHPAATVQAYRRYLELVPAGWHASEARTAVRRLDDHAR